MLTLLWIGNKGSKGVGNGNSDRTTFHYSYGGKETQKGLEAVSIPLSGRVK